MTATIVPFPTRHIDIADRAAFILLRLEESAQRPADWHAAREALARLHFKDPTIRMMLADVRRPAREGVA